MFVPKGHVSLTAAIDAVGKYRFGEDWIGGVYAELSGKLHEASDPAQRQELIKRLNISNEQWDQVTETMRVAFVGSPPQFKDAVPVILISDRGNIHKLPPQLWMNDRDAGKMFASGRAEFHPQQYNLLWLPTAGPLAGGLLLSEESFRRLTTETDEAPNGPDLSGHVVAAERHSHGGDLPVDEAAHRADADYERQRSVDTPRLEVVANLADWIFTHHSDPPFTKSALYDRASSERERTGQFTQEQFSAAYQRVYQSNAGAPPRGGWPLHEKYATVWASRIIPKEKISK